MVHSSTFLRSIGAIVSCLLLTLALQAQTAFTARLSGHQEVQPVASTGSGEVQAILTGNTLVVSGSFTGLTSPFNAAIGGGAHLHLAYAGSNGGVIFPLITVPDTDLLGGTFAAAANTFTLSNDQVTALQERRIYVNIHTVDYPGGEIRGQLLPQAATQFTTSLLGSNEPNPVLTRASGALALELTGNQLVVTGSFRNLSSAVNTALAGGAHLHLGLAGINGPVSIPLNITLAADSLSGTFAAAMNTFTLNAEQLAALPAGRLYANIHSKTYAGGELRGQIVPAVNSIFRAFLSGSQEWPPVLTRARGMVVATVQGDQLVLNGSFTGLSSAVATNIGGGAHLHAALAGSNGGVILPVKVTLSADSLSGTIDPEVNTFTLTEAQQEMMMQRRLYFNLHTRKHTSGELRGQLLHESQAFFSAFLSGSQELPRDVNTAAHGMVMLEMAGNRMIPSGSFNDLSDSLNLAILGGAHIHVGYPGQNGPVLFPLRINLLEGGADGSILPEENLLPLTASLTDSLMRRLFYVNIHTLTHPTGEIRGNLLAEANSYFLAPMSGASEPQGVNTDAYGLAAIELLDTVATVVGSFSDLNSDFNVAIAGGAHLHINYAGSNGPVAARLNTELAANLRAGIMVADSNRIKLTKAQVDTLLDRSVYTNIHTVANPSGEIRGQVLPLAGTYFHTTLDNLNEVPPVVGTDARGGLKLELSGNQLVVTGSFNGLESELNQAVAGGAHLHIAGVGKNGGVALRLRATTDATDTSGIFLPQHNTFRLDSAQATAVQQAALRAKRFYANIHSMTKAAGEIRGQILPEVNMFPGASAILLPAPGADIVLAGAAEQGFTVEFAPATDPDGDTLVYIWQLALDQAFENVIFATLTGIDTFFTTNFGTIDGLLAASGIEVGGMVTLYHRVVTSDGSNHTPSEPAAANLQRGTVTAVRNYAPAGFAAAVYPTPSERGAPLTLEVKSQEAFRAQLSVLSTLGQVVSSRTLDMPAGTLQQTITTDELSAGIYFITLHHRGRIIHVDRIVIR